MIVAGFFVLLGIAVLVRVAGNRLLPLLMPAGRLRTLALGWAGGLGGSLIDGLVWQAGPLVAGINLAAAFIGATVAVLCLGVAPFIKILLGRV